MLESSENAADVNLSDMHDDELCIKSAEGLRLCEDELIRRYTRLVRATARPYYLAGAGEEDLVQEGMLGLLNAIRSYDPSAETPFASYAKVCIASSVRGAVRAGLRKKHSPLNGYIPLVEPLFDGNADTEIPASLASDPESLILDREESDELEGTLSGLLSTFEAKILRLYLDGYTYGEISDTVGKPYKSVDNAIARIRRKLSAYLISHGDSR